MTCEPEGQRCSFAEKQLDKVILTNRQKKKINVGLNTQNVLN